MTVTELLTRKARPKWLVYGLIITICLGLGVVLTATRADAACRGPIEYEGCTYSQMRAKEAPKRGEMARNYDKGRWHQSHREWAGLTKANNRKLSRLYDDAVGRYMQKQIANGASRAEARPLFATWKGFKAATDCNGSFGVYSAFATAWCQTQRPINYVASNTTDIVLKCDGAFVAGSVVGGSIAWWGGVTVAPGALAGGSVAAAPCVTESIWDKLIPW